VPDLRFAPQPDTVPQNGLRPRWALPLDAYPQTLSVSQDGRLLAVGTAEGELLWVQAQTGEIASRARAHEQGLQVAAFGADLLATGGQDGLLRLWRANATQPHAELNLGKAWVEHLAWTPDAKHLAVAAGRTPALFTRDGSERWHLTQRAPVRALAFNPVGGLLAVGGSGGASLVRTTDGGMDRVLPHKSPLLSLAFSPDGRVLAAGTGDNTAHFWRLSDRSGPGSQMSGFDGPPFRPMALAWIGNTLATGGDVSIALWKFSGKGPEGTPPKMLHGHGDLVTQLAVDAGARWLASASRDGVLMLRDLRKDFATAGAGMLSGAACGLIWHPRDTVFYASSEQGVVALDVAV